MSNEVTASNATPLRICVFCGSQPGNGQIHLEAARALAHGLHLAGAELIYGAGTVGIMGEMGRTLIEESGPQSVHGIIPRSFLDKERPTTPNKRENDAENKIVTQSTLPATSSSGRITIVEDLPARKKLMCELISQGAPGSGFIALTGGFGTLDELVEMVTLHQHGDHKARVCLLNVGGFWDPILQWMEIAIGAGFIKKEARGMLAARETAEECLAWLKEV